MCVPVTVHIYATKHVTACVNIITTGIISIKLHVIILYNTMFYNYLLHNNNP